MKISFLIFALYSPLIFSETEDEIFNKIVSANNSSFVSNNSKPMSALYQTASLQCWLVNGKNYFAQKLVKSPIPKNATYSLKEIDDHYFENIKKELDYFLLELRTKPTHKLSIRYKVSYKSKCDEGLYERQSGASYLLDLNNDKFQIVPVCPTQKAIPLMVEKGVHSYLSDNELKNLLGSISNEKIDIIQSNILNAGGRFEEIKRLKTVYDIPLKTTMLLLDEICRK